MSPTQRNAQPPTDAQPPAAHKSLAEALAAFQGEMPTVSKARTADTGKYRYTYADLADVMGTAAPVLARHGLSFTTAPGQSAEGRLQLTGTLLHSSGESLQGVLPINGSTPQEIGSSLTYMRRYLLGCLTGVVTEADDDGQLSQQAANRGNRRREQDQEEARQRSGRQVAVAGDGAPKRRAMGAALERAGVAKGRPRLEAIGQIVGREITQHTQVTEKDAEVVLAHLAQPGLPQAAPASAEEGASPEAPAEADAEAPPEEEPPPAEEG